MEHIQQQQSRPLEHSCKMADGGITADHDIEMRENAGGLHEPFGGVIGAAQVYHTWKRCKLGRRAWLQAVEPHPWYVERGRQRFQRDRARSGVAMRFFCRKMHPHVHHLLISKVVSPANLRVVKVCVRE